MEKVSDTLYNKEVKMKLIELGFTKNLEIYQYKNSDGIITSYWVYDIYSYHGKDYKKITPISPMVYDNLLEDYKESLSR